MKSSAKSKAVITVLCILPFVAVLLSFCVGRYSLSLREFVEASISFLSSGVNSNNAETVVFKLRLPRILAALIIGGALATSGATYQSIFRNPLVSPDLLGASAGAGFGACLAIIMHANTLIIQLVAFAGGIVAVALTSLISNLLLKRKDVILVYVLIGMVINTMLQAGISITKYIADPFGDLQTITFWLMGSLAKVKLSEVWILVVIVMIGIIPIMTNRWKINLLSFNDEEAMAMGLDTKKIRLILLLFSTLLISTSVAVGGIISWVGLVIPHAVRILVGANNKLLIPASFLLGSTYLVLVDDISRALMSTEIPIGILTSLIGAPVFIILLLKGWSGWR